MTETPLDLVFIGLSLSSSWGNGHATTYRSLLRALARRGHTLTFFEADRPWYAEHRDLPEPDFCTLVLYEGLEDLATHAERFAKADAVIVGSYTHEGVGVGALVQAHTRLCAFYDVDTPITLSMLARGQDEYISRALVPGYDLYLSFTGGPTLDVLMGEFGSPLARALYCSADPAPDAPTQVEKRWDLSYLGTYSPDRQPVLEKLMLEPARAAPHLAFVVAGPQYPAEIEWPANVERIEHVGPADHADFYGASRFTLNVTRSDMVAAGFSPSVRLFEAAACATPIISDIWAGLDTLFQPDVEIVLADTSARVLGILSHWPEDLRAAMGEAALRRVRESHTGDHRARELEAAIAEARTRKSAKPTHVSLAQRLSA